MKSLTIQILALSPSLPLSLSFCVNRDLSTQLRGVLATQRILEGVGVGRPGATALSAMLNFLVRDGFGMAATLLFTASAASKFQGDVKRWRLFADIMVDVGITLEVAATQVPRNFFLPFICLGTVCKALCGVAAGSVSAPINLFWAAKGTDISDISAKFGAQQTVTAALGLIFAAIFAKSISSVQSKQVWFLYATLTALHLFANMRCMRIIAFNTVNAERMHLLFQYFWQQYIDNDKQSKIILPNPKQIALKEPLFFFLPNVRRQNLRRPKVKMGVCFDELTSHVSTEDIKIQLEKPYLISTSNIGGSSRRSRSLVKIALRTNATQRQNVEAYFDALTLCSIKEQNPCSSLNDHCNAWEQFSMAAEEAGWDLSRSDIRKLGYEILVDV